MKAQIIVVLIMGIHCTLEKKADATFYLLAETKNTWTEAIAQDVISYGSN